VPLDAFPLTSNGKIDRNALPAPAAQLEVAPAHTVAPRNLVEEKIAQTFREVLGLSRDVGIDEDFFALGGDSLQAVRMLGALDQAFDRRVPLWTLLANATVEAVAQSLGAQGLDSGSLLVPLQTTGSGAPLFCLHPLGGHVFCYADLAHALRGVRPVYGLRAAGIEGEAEPDSDIESMASRYVALIKTVQPQGPYALCGWSMGGMIALEMAQQLRASGDRVGLLAPIDTFWPSVVLPLTERVKRRGVVGMLRAPVDRWRRYRERRSLESRQDLLGVVQRAADAASASYAPQPYEGAVLLVRSQVGLPTAELDLAEWRRIATTLDTLTVPGGHWDILKQPVVQRLADELDKRMRPRENAP
jgi:pyochelin synthetase